METIEERFTMSLGKGSQVTTSGATPLTVTDTEDGRLEVTVGSCYYYGEHSTAC